MVKYLSNELSLVIHLRFFHYWKKSCRRKLNIEKYLKKSFAIIQSTQN